MKTLFLILIIFLASCQNPYIQDKDFEMPELENPFENIKNPLPKIEIGEEIWLTHFTENQ